MKVIKKKIHRSVKRGGDENCGVTGSTGTERRRRPEGSEPVGEVASVAERLLLGTAAAAEGAVVGVGQNIF